MVSPTSNSGANVPDDIAVIGLSCRFPGEASNADNFWSLLCNGRSAYTEANERWNVDAFHHAQKGRLNSSITRGGHFLKQDVSAFDATFFNITQDEASAMDPQQRFMLEVAYESFENAGITIGKLSGSQTGCFVGAFNTDWREAFCRDVDGAPTYAYTGAGIELVSARVSWFFNMQGPTLTLNTACSSGLVALHLACQSLRTGESNMALAGGVNFMLNPDFFLFASNQGFLSGDGRCKSFDAKADGYGRGEGCAAVVLKRMKDALRDGDSIRAVIRGTGVNQDGKTKGITLPSASAQADLIRSTYLSAGVDMSETSYFEAHGTGTAAGDPLELRAISETLGASRKTGQELIVGSVKPNVGHLEAVAGLAGVIKGILSLEKGLIPPNISFQIPNPQIPFEKWKIKIPTSPMQWPLENVRRLSVNSFGAGGTNAHAIIEEAKSYLARRKQQHKVNGSSKTNGYHSLKRSRLFLITAKDQEGLKRQRKSLKNDLQSKSLELDDTTMEDTYLLNLAFTLNERRSRLPWASYVVGSSLQQLCKSLDSSDAVSFRSSRPPTLGFVFTGQGAQWPRMGMELCQYEVFKKSLEEADMYLQTQLGCPWSVMDELKREGPKSKINSPFYSQPLVTILQMALVELLESWEIVPSAIIGHSSGEVAAAFCLGAISREDAWEIAYWKGALLQQLESSAPARRGAMLAAAMSASEAQRYISSATKGKVVVACINSPSGVTLSGDEEGIDEIQAKLKSEGIFERKLKVDRAYHSFHMEFYTPAFNEKLDGIVTKSARPGRQMYSTVLGKLINPHELTPEYWIQNMICPVQFSNALHELVRPMDASQQRSHNNAVDILVEIGPHSTLQGPVGQILKHYGISNVDYKSVLGRGKNAVETALTCAGALLAQGVTASTTEINDDAYPSSIGLCQPLTDLSSYQWNYAHTFWAEPRLNKEYRMRKSARRGLIGAPTPTLSENEHVWRGFIRESEEPWVAHHVVQSSILYPVAGFLAMAIEGARQLADPGRVVSRYRVRDFQIGTPAILTVGEDLEVICSLRPHVTGPLTTSPMWNQFTISTCRHNQTVRQNCSGLILLEYQPAPGSGMAVEYDFEADKVKQQFKDMHESCRIVHEASDFYKSLAAVGMNYGDTFRNLVEIRSGDSISCCTLEIADDGSTFVPPSSQRPHIIHPTTLDALLHCVFAATSGKGSNVKGGMVPTHLDELVVAADIPFASGDHLKAYATAKKHGFREVVSDIEALDTSLTRQLVTLKGLHLTAIQDLDELETDKTEGKKLCSEMSWQPSLDLMTTDELQEWINAIKSPTDQITMLVNLMTDERPDTSVLELSTCTIEQETLVPRHLIESDLHKPSRYVFSCPNNETLKKFDDVRVQKPYIDFRILDAEKEIDPQFLKSKFDLIIISGPLSENTLERVRSLQKPRGKLCHAIYQAGENLPHRYIFNIIPNRQVSNGVHHPQGSVTIIEAATSSPGSQDLATKLASELESRSFSVERVSWGQNLKGLKGKKCILLLELTSSFFQDLAEEDFHLFKCITMECSDLLWVTSFDGPARDIVTGMARTIRAEMAGLQFRTLHTTPDLLKTQKLSELIVRVLDANSEESEFLLEDETLKVCRLHETPAINSTLQGTVDGETVLMPLQEAILPLSLGVGSPGMLDTLRFEVDVRLEAKLGNHDVEMEVKASGVNFRDVMCAMGEIPDDHIGREAAGVVVRVGKMVTKLKPGDRVCCLGGGAHATLFRAPEMICHRIPDHVSFAEAASFPVVFCTAFHALVDLMRVEKGQTILIHAAAGGVGQAALQVAQYFGLEIFATVGSPDKRRQIQTLYGIPDDHIFNSRDVSFAQGIMRATKGNGVDCILNSLSGEALRQTWNCIAPFGTFVEIGIKDILMNSGLDMRPFGQQATFSFLNLEKMERLKPKLLASIFDRVMEYFQKGVFKPVTPVVTYPVSELENGFRLMQAGKHRGKIILSFDGKDVVPVLRSRAGIVRLGVDKTYVLVGGLGGLGRSLSNLLVDNGARHLCFLSRSGASSADAKALVVDLQSRGVHVKVIKCDIADEVSFKTALRICSEEMPPIKGVFQGAMVLRDTLFETMNFEQWTQSTRPKIQGTWNLHKYLPTDLDFLIILSSFSGIFGNRGQANYAAGCTFQDSLALYRHSQGLKAVSIDLGIMQDVGVLAEQGATGTIAAWVEPFGIREQEFHVLINLTIASQLDENWQSNAAQIVTGVPTGDSAHAAGVVPYFLEEDIRFSVIGRREGKDSLEGKGKNESTSLASQLSLVQSIQEAEQIVTGAIVTKLTKSLQTSASEIDEMRPLYHYGVDSLVAMEMRNWIVKELKSDVSLFDILAHTPIVQLAGTIVTSCRILPEGLRKGENSA